MLAGVIHVVPVVFSKAPDIPIRMYYSFVRLEENDTEPVPSVRKEVWGMLYGGDELQSRHLKLGGRPFEDENSSLSSPEQCRSSRTCGLTGEDGHHDAADSAQYL